MGRKIIRSLFFLVFLLVGLGTCGFCISEHEKALAERKWTPTDCTILQSYLGFAPTGYLLNVRYRYERGGRQYIGTAYRNDDAHQNDASDVDRLVDQYTVGSTQICLVNPADPTTAILAARPLWKSVVLLVGIAFVLPTALGIWFTWFPLDRDRWQMALPIRAWTLGAIFTLAGLAIFLGIALPAIRHYEAEQRWASTPCVVKWGRVRITHGSKHDSYTPDVLYQYQAGGRDYLSNCYSITNSASSSDAYQIVNNLPVGTRMTCYVDPADPYETVLDRGLDKVYWFVTPFSMVVTLVGLASLIFASSFQRTN